ncbi:MAG: hypothetical protein RR933_09030, partial [Oscillospiraceae bacterium]
QDVYEELIRQTPKNGTPVKTPDGMGVVIESSLLVQTVKVRMNDKPEAMPKSFKISDILVMGGKPLQSPPKHSEELDDTEDIQPVLYSEIELPKHQPNKQQQRPYPKQQKPIRANQQQQESANKQDENAQNNQQDKQKQKPHNRPHNKQRGKQKPKSGEAPQIINNNKA